MRRALSARAVLEAVVSRPWLGIACFAAVSVLCLLQVPRLSFQTTVHDLLVEDLPETRGYRDAKAVFGSDEIIRVVVKAADVFEPATFAKIEVLDEALGRIDGVRRVIGLPGIRRAVDPAGKLSTGELAAIVAPVALFEKNLVSADRRAAALTLFLENDADQPAVIAAVQALIDGDDGTLKPYQIGMPLVSEALVRYTIADFKRLPALTLALMALVLLLLFHRLRQMALALMVVTLALSWTFGLMAVTGVPLSLLTMVVPVFLIAVGTAYSLHVLAEHEARVRAGDTARQAVMVTFEHTALPCALAVVTTLLGVGSLLVNRIRAIQEFALFAGFGLISLLAAILLLLPAVLAVLPAPGPARPPGLLDRLLDRLLEAVVALVLARRRAIFLAVGACSLAAAGGLLLIRVETNPFAFFREDVPIRRHFEDIRRQLAGSFAVSVIADGPQELYFESPAHIAELKDFQQRLESLPGVDKAVSFADYVMLVHYALNRYDPARYAIPEEGFEARMAINNYKGLLGEELFSRFMTPGLDRANVLLFTHLSSSREFLALREQVAGVARRHLPERVQVTVTGFGVAISASSHVLVTGQAKSLLLGLSAIFGIMFVLFLSAKVGLIALVPNCFPILVNFGVMGWLGISLSSSTSLIASIAIGLAVDDTIHYLHRYNREFRKDLDKDRALADTVRGVGRPMVFTTVTIAVGFSVLMFSHFEPTAVFGLLMVVTMLAALAGDLLLLPALMLHVELVTAWDLLKLMPAVVGVPSGVVHELNQPLNAIRMGSDFLKMMLSREEGCEKGPLIEVAEEIGRQVDRASAVIGHLQAFGQRPDFDRQPVNLNEPVEHVLGIVGHQLRLDGIALKVTLNGDLPPVAGHPNRLGQVVYNLVVNAHEAIIARRRQGGGGGDEVRIETAAEADTVTLTVSDTGAGIAPRDLPRIWEPFFSTRASGRARGLGLSISRQIVRDLGGKIEVESRPGSGSTFRVVLPRSYRQAAANPQR